MKNIRYKSILLSTLSLLFILPLTGHAQVTGIEALIKAGKEDATTLTREYLRPLSSGLGASLNSGWQNSAKPHHVLGFGLDIRGGFAFVPSSDKSFDLLDLNLQKVRPADPDNTITPTLSGSDEAGPEVVVEDGGNEVARFNMPEGTGISIIPAPELQASAGILKSTEVMLRFVPKISLGDYGNFNQFGLGLKQSVNNSIPGGNMLPVDISVLLGYNRINVNGNLNVVPQADAPDPTYTGNYDNQKVKIGFNTYTIKALVGKSIPLLTVYGGIGYEYSKMNVEVTGDYPVPVTVAPGITRTETISDPVSYKQKSDNGISAMAGLNLKLGFLNIFADYTVAKYPVANAGIGFSF